MTEGVRPDAAEITLRTMRAPRLVPRSRPSIHPAVFTKLVNASQVGGARGYDVLGLALTRRVLADPVHYLDGDGVAQLRLLVEGSEIRSIVRLFVRRIRWALRSVPFRRRYHSFADGLARAVREHQAATSRSPKWSLDPTLSTL